MKENKMIPGEWLGRERPAIFNSYWPCWRHLAGRDDSWWLKCWGGASGITKQYTWKAISGRLQSYCAPCDSYFVLIWPPSVLSQPTTICLWKVTKKRQKKTHTRYTQNLVLCFHLQSCIVNIMQFLEFINQNKNNMTDDTCNLSIIILDVYINRAHGVEIVANSPICHHILHRIGPLGQFGLVVTMFVCLCGCLSVPYPCDFCSPRGAPWYWYPEKMYIITTGIGEHQSIGTLKKCTNENVHHYNWHWGAPWHRYPEKMFHQKCTSLQPALGSTVASVPWKM